jgi:hypothetical protein
MSARPLQQRLAVSDSLGGLACCRNLKGRGCGAGRTSSKQFSNANTHLFARKHSKSLPLRVNVLLVIIRPERSEILPVSRCHSLCLKDPIFANHDPLAQSRRLPLARIQQAPGRTDSPSPRSRCDTKRRQLACQRVRTTQAIFYTRMTRVRNRP